MLTTADFLRRYRIGRWMLNRIAPSTEATNLAVMFRSQEHNIVWHLLEDSGGPRDRKFRQNVLKLVIIYQCLAVKSELLPDLMLKILDEKVQATLNDLRQVVEHEGIGIPLEVK